MQFSSAAITAFLLSVGGASAFSAAPSSSYVSSRVSTGASPTAAVVAPHVAGCACAGCSSTRRSSIVLFADTAAADTAAADVPAEVEAMDGIESEDEAHNADRPARKSLKKKAPRGKPLSEFNAGDTVKAKVKALASYGAFLDIGAQTDGLLHISQLSVDYVSDVTEILEVGQEVDVRIVSIDEKKGQVALTLLSASEEEEAKANQQQARAPRTPRGGSNRRDDTALLATLVEKGYDQAQFVEGTVVSTVDFGAFVRVDASTLNSECDGQFDGLVHISALTTGRVDSVESVVKPDDKVQVRVKDIAGRKVSLSMVSVEDEEAKRQSMGGPPPAQQGNKNWKADLTTMQKDMPTFKNTPLVVDLRK